MDTKKCRYKYVRRSPAFREIGHCKDGESFWDGNEIKVIYVCFFLEGQTS